MKFLMIFLIFSIFSFQEITKSDLNGKWQLLYFYNIEKNKKLLPENNNQFVKISFDDDGAIGFIKGCTINNKFFGDYLIKENSKNILVKRIHKTQNKEYGWASEIENNLRLANTFERVGDTLKIGYGKNNMQLILIKDISKF